jgi:hypothetical protein
MQRESAGASKKHTVVDALFLLAIGMAVLVLVAAPFAVIWLILRWR